MASAMLCNITLPTTKAVVSKMKIGSLVFQSPEILQTICNYYLNIGGRRIKDKAQISDLFMSESQ